MAHIQKVHEENCKFEVLSDHILQSSLHAGQGSGHIDVVFDVYRNQSIKHAERVSRGSQDGVKFKTIRSGHNIRNWRRLLTCTVTKNKVTKFLADSWQEPSRREKLGDKTMLVASQELCFKLTASTYEEVDILANTQEEADTCLFLHAQHAALTHSLVIMADDTDVFIISLGLSSSINCKMYIRLGTKSHVRMIDIS